MRLGLIHRPLAHLPRLAAHLDVDALLVPDICDWHAYVALDGDALGNDVHANCVPCGALRRVQIARAVAAGDHRRPSSYDAMRLYVDWAGWNGSPESDVGTGSDIAAQAWSARGIHWGDQWEDVPGIASVSPGHLRAAIAYLGPVQLDLLLPVGWQDADTWDAVSGPAAVEWGAHRVCAGAYDADGSVRVITWGTERTITPAGLARVLNAEATLSRSWLDTMGRSPAGLDLAALEGAMRAAA